LDLDHEETGSGFVVRTGMRLCADI
jgi:hypothetical protein